MISVRTCGVYARKTPLPPLSPAHVEPADVTVQNPAFAMD
jgi:hypothetical protein